MISEAEEDKVEETHRGSFLGSCGFGEGMEQRGETALGE